MGQDLFKYLPPEIITNILLRLAVGTIAISKCVCKPWLDLLESDEFVKSHLSRSAAALALLTPEGNSSRCTVFELEEEIDVESSHDHHYNHLTRFNFPHRVNIAGSANGMLFLLKYDCPAVCNPISREYIELHCPQEFHRQGLLIYGFGASKVSGQYKVVRIFSYCCCLVYTLGTGSWRRISASFRYAYNFNLDGAFVNGNLHWLVSNLTNTTWVSCFDLETECFSKFSIPPLPEGNESIYTLSALRDCLCFCYDTEEDEIVIWLMKEYGVEKSWTKEYVFNKTYNFGSNNCLDVYPIKVFNDGDILMIMGDRLPFYYSNKMKTIRSVSVFDDLGDGYINSRLLTPSFLSLKSFPMENVISF